jgi:hypothetical protein
VLRWPHGGHGDCARARADYGARRWARGRPGRASAGDLLRRSATRGADASKPSFGSGETKRTRVPMDSNRVKWTHSQTLPSERIMSS